MGKAPKPVYATDDELKSAEVQLHQKIDALGPVLATKTEVKDSIAKAEAELQELVEVVAKNAAAADEAAQRVAKDSKAFTEVSANEVLDEVKPLISKLGTNTRLDTDALDDRITDTDAKIRQDVSEKFLEVCEEVDARFNALERDLTALIELRASQAAENLAQQRQLLDAVIEDRRQEAADDNAKIRAEVAAEFQRLRGEQAATDALQDEVGKKEHAALLLRIDADAKQAEENRIAAARDVAQAREEALQNLANVEAAVNAHMADLDLEDLRLNNVLSRVMEVPTRRVDWTIANAANCLVPPSGSDGQASYSSFYSPMFHAASGEDLQLELRSYALQLSPEGARIGVGNLALFLWASRGMQIAMRLFIGSKQSSVESSFAERCANGTKRLCYVEEQIDESDGSLRVGVEFLEVIRDMKPFSGKVPHVVALDPVVGTVRYHRHVNNRIVPQVRKEVERLQARLVRRVEWQLEHASSLQQLFKPVEPICSPIFGAAGVEGMQLLFYPSGYAGATEGFCSLFLYAPAGVSMKFRLTAGSKMADANNTFDEAGAYGRANFCRFEILPDGINDTILITLEIEEVTQDLHFSVGAKEAASGQKQRSPAESAVKLKRTPAKESLVDIKPLASMWTSKALGDMAAPPDGYHPFSALKEQRGKARSAVALAATRQSFDAADRGRASVASTPISPAGSLVAPHRGHSRSTSPEGPSCHAKSLPQLRATGRGLPVRRTGNRSPMMLAGMTH